MKQKKKKIENIGCLNPSNSQISNYYLTNRTYNLIPEDSSQQHAITLKTQEKYKNIQYNKSI